MLLEFGEEGGVQIVRVVGDLDLSAAPGVQESLLLRVPGTGALVLDLGGVGFMDSLGLRALVVTQRRLEAAGRSLVIRGAGGQVRQALEITGLGAVFDLR